MTLHAEGPFDVKTTPITPDDATAGAAIGRFALDKQFHGDLHAASKGLMLTAGDPGKGSAGYVAIEQVTGTLHGQSGSFALQHNGAMDKGNFNLTVAVVPGSGAGELAGIAGSMSITNVSGKHSYTFDYTLPGATQ
jgi:hypothetical protein